MLRVSLAPLPARFLEYAIELIEISAFHEWSRKVESCSTPVFEPVDFSQLDPRFSILGHHSPKTLGTLHEAADAFLADLCQECTELLHESYLDVLDNHNFAPAPESKSPQRPEQNVSRLRSGRILNWHDWAGYGTMVNLGMAVRDSGTILISSACDGEILIVLQ